MTKDITITTRIGQHDIDVKISHMKKFLEKQHAVRMFVQTRYTRGMREEEEEARCDLYSEEHRKAVGGAGEQNEGE